MIQFLENNYSTADKAMAIRAIDKWVAGYKVISFKPLIKYPKGSNYESTYKKLTEYLRKKLPNVANIPKITNAIHQFTQLPLNTIKNDLKWGEGPVLEIVQLDNYPNYNTCDEDTVGHFDKVDNPDKIFLDIDYVNQLENGTLIEGDSDAAIFLLVLPYYMNMFIMVIMPPDLNIRVRRV